MAIAEVLTYCGGIPSATKTGDMVVSAHHNAIHIDLGFLKGKYSIPFENISNLSIKTDEQISKDVTLTRLLLIGVFAFGAKKKTKTVTNYLVIDYVDKNISSSAIFTGPKVPKFHASMLTALQDFYRLNPHKVKKSEETPVSDPYSEIEKLHGLLEKNMITQEEFEKKKSILLGL